MVLWVIPPTYTFPVLKAYAKWENVALGTDLSFSFFFCRFAIRKLASSHAKIPMVATFGFLPPDQNPIEDFVELVI